MADDRNEPERPRFEPEIIPPDRDGRQSDWRSAPWRTRPFGDTDTRGRVYVARLGPFGMALLLLAIAAIVAIIVIAIVGAVLIWIPVVVAVLIIGTVLRLTRGFGPR